MKPKPKEWTDAEKLALRKLARQALSAKEIAQRLKRYGKSVRRVAAEMKLPLRVR